MKLCVHYGLVTKEQKKLWKNINDNPKFEFSREEKIAGFKERKALETQLNNLEKLKDEDSVRDAV